MSRQGDDIYVRICGWNPYYMTKFELLIMALLILTIIPPAYCLGEGTPYIPTEDGVYYRVEVITDEEMERWGFKPEHFWNLTNPDSDILRAMRYPNMFVLTEINDTEHPSPDSFLAKYYANGAHPYFKYNGTYYCVDIYCVWYDKGGSAGGSPYIGDSYWRVVLLDEEPENYIEILDPNPYLKACFEHPGTYVLFDPNYFIDHPEEIKPKQLWELQP